MHLKKLTAKAQLYGAETDVFIMYYFIFTTWENLALIKKI